MKFDFSVETRGDPIISPQKAIKLGEVILEYCKKHPERFSEFKNKQKEVKEDE